MPTFARRAAGFTLIETVIALVVLALGAAAVLQHLRALVVRADHEQAHVVETMTLLNEAARLPLWPAEQQQAELFQAGEGLYGQHLRLVWPNFPAAPAVTVSNFSWQAEPLPPLDMAFTPVQQFHLGSGARTYTRLARALPPPEHSSRDDVDQSRAEHSLELERQERQERQQVLDEVDALLQDEARPQGSADY